MPTQDQIERLPKWAQDHIRSIEMQRQSAIDALNNAIDSQTKSPIFTDDWACTGEQQGPSKKRLYVQARVMQFEWLGVSLTVLLASERDGARMPGIDLSWSTVDDPLAVVGLVPMSFGRMQLVHPKYMKR